MIVTQRIRGLFWLVVMTQLLVVSLVYWGHFLVMGSFYTDLAMPERYILYNLLMLGGIVLEAIYRYDRNPGLINRPLAQLHLVSLRQTIAAAVPVFFGLVAAKDPVISRVFLFTAPIPLYAAFLFANFQLSRWIARATFRETQTEKVLLVGSRFKAQKMRSWLERKKLLGLVPIGLLTNEENGPQMDWPVLGGTEDLESVVKKHQIRQVILVEFPAVTDFLYTMISLCENLGVRLVVVSDLDETFRHTVLYSEDDGVSFFSMREEQLENPINRGIKRTVDILVALFVVVVILPPMMLLVWLFQRLQSPGPLFFRQTRAGMENHPFEIIKFRTMHVKNPNAASQATLNDPRVFLAGRLLRRYSIDELPQFLNVLKGEMSVVGPRPHMLEHNDRFARIMANYHVRTWIKPGLTGLAQVRGYRGETKSDGDLKQRVIADLSYLENWSLAMDIAILIRTVYHVIFPPKSAY